MAIPGRQRLRTAFKKSRCIAPLYTSGPVAVTADGTCIVTCVGEQVLCTEIATGAEITRFATDSQTITSLCISPSSKHIAIFSSSLALRIYELPTVERASPLTQPIRVIARAHDAPVHVCKIDPTSSYLASGSTDGVVKVWDIFRGFVTHVFKGHGGVVSALAFHYPVDPSSVSQRNKMQLVTASVDTRIRIFELSATSKEKPSLKPIAVLEGHVSVPRGLEVSADGNWLVSGGRDSVVMVWDVSCIHQTTSLDPKGKGKGKAAVPRLVKTIPVLERVEALGLLQPGQVISGEQGKSDRPLVYTGGQKGVVRIWNIEEGKALLVLGNEKEGISEEQEEQLQIMDVIYIPSSSTMISVHANHNILFHSLINASLTRQLIGFNDEIVDASFLSPDSSNKDSHLALATNSSLIRMYSTSTLDSRLLDGHHDIVLSLDHSADGNLLASSSKDRTARLWALSTDEDWVYRCVAICEGHAESVGAIALSRSAGKPQFVFTGSQDRTIKMWNLLDIDPAAREPLKCKSLLTVNAHDKDINSLDIAPNDRLLASGSQDRTAKIYAIDYSSAKSELKLLGICKGHKRGVWSVRFSRTERVLATGSGDKTIKLWNLDDFSCVKTFEGHTNSILRAEFINQGTQLVSAASDGLVKVWNVREEDCMTTLDNHEDKVWALAISNDERTIVSGSADSVVTFWEDSTEEQEQEKEAERQEMVTLEQNYQNYLALRDYRRAIELALAMEQPGRLFSLFKQTVPATSDRAFTGDPTVDEVIRTLGGLELTKLLRFVRDWNANAKTSAVAQTVLYAILKLQSADKILKAAGGQSETAIKEIIDGIIPYSERHLSRLEGLVQDSYIVDFILGEMDDGMVVDAMDID